MPSCRFHLYVTADQLLEYYRGHASQVIVTAENGQRVSFPAVELRQFATPDGVEGYFELRFTAENKLVGLTRID